MVRGSPCTIPLGGEPAQRRRWLQAGTAWARDRRVDHQVGRERPLVEVCSRPVS